MAARKWKWRLKVLGLVAILIAVGLAAIHYLPPYLHHHHIVGLMRDFQASPSQQTGDPMIDLLVTHDVSQEDGDAILYLLVQPEVTVKDSYESNEEIVIHIAPKFPVKVANLYSGNSNSIFIDGVTTGGGLWECQSLEIAPELSGSSTFGNRAALHPPIRIRVPGTYRGTVGLGFDLNVGLSREMIEYLLGVDNSLLARVLRYLNLRGSAPHESSNYQCYYEFPIETRIVPATPRSQPATSP
jgi:hypothetical protein